MDTLTKVNLLMKIHDLLSRELYATALSIEDYVKENPKMTQGQWMAILVGYTMLCLGKEKILLKETDHDVSQMQNS